jgi:hypothetical protein
MSSSPGSIRPRPGSSSVRVGATVPAGQRAYRRSLSAASIRTRRSSIRPSCSANGSPLRAGMTPGGTCRSVAERLVCPGPPGEEPRERDRRRVAARGGVCSPEPSTGPDDSGGVAGPAASRGTGTSTAARLARSAVTNRAELRPGAGGRAQRVTRCGSAPSRPPSSGGAGRPLSSTAVSAESLSDLHGLVLCFDGLGTDQTHRVQPSPAVTRVSGRMSEAARPMGSTAAGRSRGRDDTRGSAPTHAGHGAGGVVGSRDLSLGRACSRRPGRGRETHSFGIAQF